MSGHTPGPWVACYSKACGVVTGFHIAGQKHGSTVPVVEAEQRFAPSRQPEEIEANAALIAAAPDLLAALKAMLAVVVTVPEMNNHIFDGLGIQVNAAIAKAEGRQ